MHKNCEEKLGFPPYLTESDLTFPRSTFLHKYGWVSSQISRIYLTQILTIDHHDPVWYKYGSVLLKMFFEQLFYLYACNSMTQYWVCNSLPEKKCILTLSELSTYEKFESFFLLSSAPSG